MLKWIISAYRALPIASRWRAILRMRLVRALPWAFPRHAKPGQAPKSLAPAPGTADHDDYVFWGVIDWHLRCQRPQHLALNLIARGHRVFYVSSNLIPSRVPGFRVEQLDESARLFQIHLAAGDVAAVYFAAPSPAARAQIRLGLSQAFAWGDCRHPVSLVQHPFWYELALVMPHRLLVYDRMDLHEGFGDWPVDLGRLEQDLIKGADLTVVSSAWLDSETAALTDRRALIRNAGEYQHFASRPPTFFSDPQWPVVVGYYGAIAQWLDLDLIEAIANRFADALVLLIGHDQVGAARRLRHLRNVRLLGEVPYRDLPFYLYGFSVAILPFRVTPLTLATNPVKVYEYLSAGVPVVATDLPETIVLAPLVACARTVADFLEAIAQAVPESPDGPPRRQRQRFAAEQTWKQRTSELLAAVAERQSIAARNNDQSQPTPGARFNPAGPIPAPPSSAVSV